MKKLGVIFAICSASIFADNVETFLDLNFSSDYSFKNELKMEKNSPDIGFSMEFYKPLTGKRQGGFGLIQNSVDTTGQYKNKINLTTYFLTEKYYFNSGKLSTYGKIMGGGYYPSSLLGKTEIGSPYEVQMKNGWFYGGALGVQYKKIMIQAQYKSYIGDCSTPQGNTKFDYNTWSLNLGYNIEI